MASLKVGLALWVLPPACVATRPALPALILEGIGWDLPGKKEDGKRNGLLSLTSIGSGEAINDFVWPVESKEINCTVGVHGHSSIWFAKKSFTLHLQKPNGKKLKTGFGRDWRPSHGFDLFGPYADRSLMRNALAFSWGHDMGVGAPKTSFVELSFKMQNGTVDYQGVYSIMELVKHARLGLHDGDMLIKYDWPDSDRELRHAWNSGESAFSLSYPKDEAGPGEPADGHQLPAVGTKTYAMAQILNESMGFTSAPDVKLLDINSWVNYVLFCEFSGNPDAYLFSTFSYFKDGKLHGGPIWDYDLAFGNTMDKAQSYEFGGWLWQAAVQRQSHVGTFIKRLMPMRVGDGNQTFAQACERRWAALRSGPLSHKAVDRLISTHGILLDASGAASRNFQVWGTLGELLQGQGPFLNPYLGSRAARTWQEEVGFLRVWVHHRMQAMDTIVAAGNDNPASPQDPQSRFSAEAWVGALATGLLFSAMVILPLRPGHWLRIAAKPFSHDTPGPSPAAAPLLQVA